jgi:hypothetical protein
LQLLYLKNKDTYSRGPLITYPPGPDPEHWLEKAFLFILSHFDSFWAKVENSVILGPKNFM